MGGQGRGPLAGQVKTVADYWGVLSPMHPDHVYNPIGYEVTPDPRTTSGGALKEHGDGAALQCLLQFFGGAWGNCITGTHPDFRHLGETFEGRMPSKTNFQVCTGGPVGGPLVALERNYGG